MGTWQKQLKSRGQSASWWRNPSQHLSWPWEEEWKQIRWETSFWGGFWWSVYLETPRGCSLKALRLQELLKHPTLCNKPNNTSLEEWRQNWSNTKLCKHQGKHRSASGGRWEPGQEKGYRKHHNFTREAVRKTQFKDYCNNTFKSNSLTWKLQTIDWPVAFLNPCVKSLDSVLQNGNALPVEGTLEVAVISPFLRKGLRQCCGLCGDLRSLNHVLPGEISEITLPTVKREDNS